MTFKSWPTEERRRFAKLIFGLAIYAISIYLCLTWFDWKLLLLIILWQWAGNIQRSAND